ncbi:DDE-type integrase/transposase/recombinase [Methylophilus sp. YYY-1]|uniref:DDE-type integrase/transposase/recombinase n=1 Tax=Methylophilus sp. YYY-1 TaxID=2682087 RepID=UPI0023B30176|nr:DDE-type integrase/transposase/recombinase [Methylophilus sp. YYY-1]
MMRFSFKKGLVFIEVNTRWQLLRRLVTNKLQFESDQGEIRNLTDKEVLGFWRSGEWSVDISTLGVSGDSIYLVTPPDLSTFPLKWQELAKRRLHYINFVLPEGKRFRADSWQPLVDAAAKLINDPNPPCPASVLGWWKKYRITKSISSLLPKTNFGYSKKEDPRFKIFEDVINQTYLNAQKVPGKEIVDRVNRRIQLHNSTQSPESRIKIVAKSTIYTWIRQLRQDISDSSRLGAEVTRKKYRTVMGGLKVHGVLERVEIDHTPLDLIVIDKTTMLPLGRAWLTLALDKFSRIVVGFYISFNAPSSYSVLQCLKQMILTKDDLLKRYPDIQNEWPVFGVPDLLALDNGMDLHADALKKACLELGIQILYCPAATPEMKGSVERFFRTINQGLIHKLPGTTFSNIDERGDYPAEDLAAIDMETLVHLVTKWTVDVYNVSPHRGINDTPLNKWRSSAKYRDIELPVYPTQLEVIVGVPARRTVFHYGIELEGLHYNNRQLQEVRKISGQNLQVELKFYEDQVQFIDVFDPFTKEYLRVDAVHEDYTKDLHREAHRLARVQARKRFGEQYSMPDLMDAREEIEGIIKDALKAKKMGSRKLAANLLMQDSVSVFESRNPIEDIHKPPKRNTSSSPEPLESGLDDDLPSVSSRYAGISDSHEESR